MGQEILSWKGIKAEDYVNDLQDLSTAIDQLGLLIIAWMYHRHFVVFMKDYVWSTQKNNSIENCAIYFAYNGGSSFLDTMEVEPIVNDDNVDLFVDDMMGTLEKLPYAACQTSPPHIYDDNNGSEESTLYEPPVLPGNSPLYAVPSSKLPLENKESTLSGESTLLPSPSKQRRLNQSEPPGNRMPNASSNCKQRQSNKNKAARKAQAAKALEKARAAKSKKYLEKQELERLLADKKKKDTELKEKFNCSDVSIDLEKCDNTLDERKAKPTELKEKDPILDHVAHVQPDQVDLLTEKESDNKSRGSSKISETKHETTDGKLKYTGNDLKKPKKQEKKLKCPDTACDQVFPYVKDLNSHIKHSHPDLKFKCEYCPWMYETHNVLYKHEYKHFQLPFCCHF